MRREKPPCAVVLGRKGQLRRQEERLLVTLRAKDPDSLIASQTAVDVLASCKASGEEARAAVESAKLAAKKETSIRENYRLVAATAAECCSPFRD